MHRWFLIVLLIPVTARAQLSGYASSTGTAQSNPLNNYEMTSDRVMEGYCELNYADTTEVRIWKLGYVGGLMLFNGLSGRNYYEHQVKAEVQLGRLRISGAVGARHDKGEFKEYDNLGMELGGFLTLREGGPKFILSNQVGLRNYYYVRELSNVTSTLKVALTAGERKDFETRYFVSLGLKHFLTNTIDSTSFSVVQSPGRSNNGKGKSLGNAPGLVKKQSVLATSESPTSIQITGGIVIGEDWPDGSLDVGLAYRIGLNSDTRVITHVATSSLIGEDIYNDHFSYSGPELSLTFRQELPLELRLSITGEIQLRNYLAPSFDLSGNESNPDRVDKRASGQISMERTIELTETFSFDVSLNLTILRNQSNDAYNDYSASGVGLGLGVGF